MTRSPTPQRGLCTALGLLVAHIAAGGTETDRFQGSQLKPGQQVQTRAACINTKQRGNALSTVSTTNESGQGEGRGTPHINQAQTSRAKT